MKAVLHLLFLSAAWLVMSVAEGAPDIAVDLKVAPAAIAKGVQPQFVVTVRALAPAVRIMKFEERGDLRANYARLRIERNGKRVDVPTAISDPGPTSDDDYVELKTGEELVFEHDGRPLTLTNLAPGTYTAYVLVEADWSAEPVSSNRVAFTVLQ